MISKIWMKILLPMSELDFGIDINKEALMQVQRMKKVWDTKIDYLKSAFTVHRYMTAVLVVLSHRIMIEQTSLVTITNANQYTSNPWRL